MAPTVKDLRKLISQCWHADVDRRPNFRTIAERLRTLYNVEKHSSKLCMSALNLNEDPHPKRGGAYVGEGGVCVEHVSLTGVDLACVIVKSAIDVASLQNLRNACLLDRARLNKHQARKRGECWACRMEC